LLNNIRKKLFDLKETINNLNDFKLKNNYEYKLLRKLTVGEKFDNDSHLGAFINISDNENNSLIICKNVTSHETIKFNDDFKLNSKTQYIFNKLNGNNSTSYETPIYLEKADNSLEDVVINKIYNKDDNRFFISKALYPQTLYNDLIYKNNINYFLYKENYNNIVIINHDHKEPLLNKIINFSKEKGIPITNNILDYNNFMLYLNYKLTIEDIKALESLSLVSPLTNYKQFPLIELNKAHKIYNILDDQYITQNKNVFLKINQDVDNICKLGENVIKKFS